MGVVGARTKRKWTDNLVSLIKGGEGTADKTAVSVADGRIIQLSEEDDSADRSPETILNQAMKIL